MAIKISNLVPLNVFNCSQFVVGKFSNPATASSGILSPVPPNWYHSLIVHFSVPLPPTTYIHPKVTHILFVLPLSMLLHIIATKLIIRCQGVVIGHASCKQEIYRKNIKGKCTTSALDTWTEYFKRDLQSECFVWTYHRICCHCTLRLGSGVITLDTRAHLKAIGVVCIHEK